MKRFFALSLAASAALLGTSLAFAQDAAATAPAAYDTLSVPPSGLDVRIFDTIIPLLAHYPKLTALLLLVGTLRAPCKLFCAWLDRRSAIDGDNSPVDRVVGSPLYRGFHFAVDALTSVKLDSVFRSVGAGALSAAMLVAGLLLVPFVSGCSSYKHERFTDAGQPIERTTFSAPWLSKTTVENLKSRVNEKRGTNTYSRSFGIDSAEAKTDVEGVQALQSLIGASLLQALKTGAEIAK